MQWRHGPGRRPRHLAGAAILYIVAGPPPRGMIPITKMVRSGIVFDIIGLVLIVLLIPVMATLIIA